MISTNYPDYPSDNDHNSPQEDLLNAGPATFEEQELQERHWEAQVLLDQVGTAAMQVAQLQAQLKLAKRNLREAEKTYCKAMENLNKPPKVEKPTKGKTKNSVANNGTSHAEEKELPQPVSSSPTPAVAKPRLIDKSQFPPPPPWQEIELAELELPEELQNPIYDAGILSLGQLQEVLEKGNRNFTKTTGLNSVDAKTVHTTLKNWLEENYPAEFPPAKKHTR